MGAPPEIACWLDEIQRENDLCKSGDVVSMCFGTDPELDEFMVPLSLIHSFLLFLSSHTHERANATFVRYLFQETYCDMLVKYKSDLTRPFDEATTFLNKMETQLSDLCSTGASVESVPTLSG